MKKITYILILFLIYSSHLFSQNFNKWGTNPKLNASINNPSLMGVFNTTQYTYNYIMAYQPISHNVTQQHYNDINLMGRVKNSKTSIGGGARYEKTYSNDYESSALSYGAWLSMGYQWSFKNQNNLAVGITLGHQYRENQYFVSHLPGYPDVKNFFKTKEEAKGSLISNLGLSYFGGNFFISLSNTGLYGMYDFSIYSRAILSPFGGISRLNYYEEIVYSYYLGIELKPISDVEVGISYSNSMDKQELNSINSYLSYTYKKFKGSYSLSNNKIYFEDFGIYHDRDWVHAFTLSYIIL